MNPTDSSESLASLIASMKPSFLVKDEQEQGIRQVFLSNPAQIDPLFLLNRGDETIVVGTGFSEIKHAGRTYQSFPDMRLLFSERSHIRAWILLHENIDVSLFETILPALDFPPIYTTRNIIAKFRDKIQNPEFRDKIRFFEVFSEEIPSRKIGAFECGIATHENMHIFAIRSGKTALSYPHLPVHEDAHKIEGAQPIVSLDTEYQAYATTFGAGEILVLTPQNAQKQSMKFSFDTFYRDGESVGVEAGYTLSDRKTLSESGVLTFTLTEDTRARTIAGHIFIDSRGFVHSHETMRVHKEILKAIRLNYESIVAQNPHIDRGELAQLLRKEIAKYCFVLTGRAPVVMPIIQ